MTGDEPFKLLDENKEITVFFHQCLLGSSVKQIRIQGKKKDEINFTIIPTIDMADTILNNWYRPLSQFERADFLSKAIKMYQIVLSERLNG